MVRRLFYIFFILAVCSHVYAQETLTNDSGTLKLPKYSVIGIISHINNPSFQVQKIDSTFLKTHLSSSLASILESQSQIQIMNYGNSMLASSSYRGLDARHTSVFWNGININQAVIGMTDLNLIPSISAQNISVWQGGNSALLGTGNMAGSIHLTTSPDHRKTTRISYNQSVGSFGLHTETAELQLSNKHIFSRTVFQYSAAENDYSYLLPNTTGSKEFVQSNSVFKNLNFIQDLSFNLNRAGELNFHYWYEDVVRHIPPTLSEGNSKAIQKDLSHRLVLDWQKGIKSWQFGIKAAYMIDKLSYDDTTSRIFSNYQLNSFVSKLNIDHTFKKHLKYYLNLEYNNYNVHNTNYIESNLFRYMLKAGTGLNAHYFKRKLWIDAGLAWAENNIENSPLTPSLGLRYKLLKHLSLKANASYNYTFPTFNDLYWQPGGNPELLPEQGWSYQGGAEWKKKRNNFNHKIYFTAFSQKVENWITWIPSSNGYWAPVNYKNVWSRGIEFGGNASYQIGSNSSLKFLLNYSYTVATNEEISNQRDAAVTHQLIYVPYYKANATLIYQYKNFRFRLNAYYNGAEYTTSDNSSVLPAYYLLNSGLYYKFHIGKVKMSTGVQVNNITNHFYQPILGYIMPGRNYEANLKIYINKIEN